jgi:hypothetical protein
MIAYPPPIGSPEEKQYNKFLLASKCIFEEFSGITCVPCTAALVGAVQS